MQRPDPLKRQRVGTPITSGQIDKKGKGVVLKHLSAVITADSALGINRSSDGSRFSLPMERAPLNIPSHATNVSASLVKATIVNPFSNKADMPNPLFIETSFTYGGINPRGDISSILAMIPHEKKDDIITYETGTPVHIPCNTVLKGSNPQAIEFRLVDKNGAAINMVNGSDVTEPWGVQVLIEW